MDMNYHTKITEIGIVASAALEDKMLIIFKEGAPQDIVDYCFIHHHNILKKPIKIGDQVQFDHHTFTITAVGEVASENLAQLGHITFFFDNANKATFPGSIHLQSSSLPNLSINSEICFFSL